MLTRALSSAARLARRLAVARGAAVVVRDPREVEQLDQLLAWAQQAQAELNAESQRRTQEVLGPLGLPSAYTQLRRLQDGAYVIERGRA